MEMAKRIEDHNAGLSLEQIDQEVLDKTLCVIGCDNLSTEDILKFFSNFNPDKVAWVDDGRVKLIWHQQTAAIRCLMANTMNAQRKGLSYLENS